MASIRRLKVKSSSSSAEKIAGNDDLLLQILICLPFKSLLKFKCVSKHWLSVITNPQFSRRGYLPCICGLFLRTYSRHAYQTDFINLNCNHTETLSSVTYPPNKAIVQSCNGLLLCCDIPPYSSESVYVCNPTTRQFTALPPPLNRSGSFILAFDPLSSPHYKAICVIQKEIEEPDFQIEIYSSKSGEWRESEAESSTHWDSAIYGGVYWNGGIHWYTDFGPCFYFDLDEERIKEMPMPNPIPDDWYRRRVMYFKESRGHLHLVEIYHPPSTQFDVWELKRDYSGWFLKYKVDLDGLVREYPGMIRDYIDPSEVNYYVFEIFCIVEGETEEESYMVLHIPRNIVRYDFNTQNVRKICDFPPSPDHRHDETAGNFYYTSSYQYIESLVRL